MKKLNRVDYTFEEISIIISVNNTAEQKKLSVKCNKQNKKSPIATKATQKNQRVTKTKAYPE